MKKYLFYSLFFVLFTLPISYVDVGFNLNETYAQAGPSSQTGTINADPVSTDEIAGCETGSVSGIAPFRQWFAGCSTPLLVTASGYILYAAAGTFDFFLQLTLEPEHLRANYIATTWATMRDLANITFILGIIVVALFMITGADRRFSGLSTKDMATRLIIVALLLNFSLFFAQVVIDAGNLTAGVFWSQIKNSGLPDSGYSALLQSGGSTAGVNIAGTAVDVQNSPSPSAPIVSSLNLVKTTEDSPGLLSVEIVNKLSSNGNSTGFLFALNILIVIVTFLVGRSLFKTGFMFLTRTVVLIILMIVSPLAFVCYFLPKADQYFTRWLSHLVAKSFCVVAYLFFIFLLLKILEGTTMGSGTDFANFEDQLTLLFLFIAVNTGIIVVTLGIADKVATNMCEGGVAGIGSTIMKVGVGTAAMATGGAAGFAARASVGRLGRRLTKSETVGKLASGDSAMGRALGQTLYSAGETANKAKFGLKKGYGDKMVEQAQIRTNRMDAFVGLRKKQIQAGVKEDLIQEKMDKVMPALTEKLRDSFSEERAGVVKQNLDKGMKLADAEAAATKAIDEKMAPQLENIKTETRKNIESKITPDQLASATNQKTKEIAKEKLQIGAQKSNVLDWALAGGVAAYGEALDGYKVFDEGDKRKDREKASLIAEKQKMAIDNTQKANDMDREIDNLATIMTNDDMGVMLDERTIDQLRKDGKIDTSGLEALIKSAMTTKSIDSEGNIVKTLNQEGYNNAMAGLDQDMQTVRDKFKSEAEPVVETYKTADAKLQQLQTDDPTNTTEIENAKRVLAQAKKDVATIQEQANKAVNAVGRKTTNIVKEGLKAQLQQATALGASQYENTADEVQAAIDSVDSGDSKDLGIADRIAN